MTHLNASMCRTLNPGLALELDNYRLPFHLLDPFVFVIVLPSNITIGTPGIAILLYCLYLMNLKIRSELESFTEIINLRTVFEI